MRWMTGLLLPLLAGCSVVAVGPFPRTGIPAAIAAPAQQRLEWVTVGTGEQIYRCDPKKDAPGQYEWVPQATESRLRDVAGKPVGRHYAGPTWEAEDGSKVVGSVEAQTDAPGRNAIPWLRLAGKASGTGMFAGVTGIQRANTVGGLPPSGGCKEQDRGRIVRVEYSADYNFYVPR